jgi:RNA polymerase sigma factor (sigma-70 family)
MTPDTFELLLAWLGSDREAAALQYETIRAGLIRIFTARGCLEAEDLADETFNRVAAKAETLRETYEGPPVRYFYGVADKIRLEYLRRQRPHTSLEEVAELRAPEPVAEEASDEQACLSRCLGELRPEQRQFILSYYRETKKAKVELHETMAADLGLTKEGLRTRAFRLKNDLGRCIHKCLRNGRGA